MTDLDVTKLDKDLPGREVLLRLSGAQVHTVVSESVVGGGSCVDSQHSAGASRRRRRKADRHRLTYRNVYGVCDMRRRL